MQQVTGAASDTRGRQLGAEGEQEPSRPEGVAAEQREEPGCAGGEELLVRQRRQGHAQAVEVGEGLVEEPAGS